MVLCSVLLEARSGGHRFLSTSFDKFTIVSLICKLLRFLVGNLLVEVSLSAAFTSSESEIQRSVGAQIPS